MVIAEKPVYDWQIPGYCVESPVEMAVRLTRAICRVS